MMSVSQAAPRAEGPAGLPTGSEKEMVFRDPKTLNKDSRTRRDAMRTVANEALERPGSGDVGGRQPAAE